MAVASVLQAIGNISGIPSGSRNIVSDLVTNAIYLPSISLTLANGANTITVPSTAVGVLILFASTSTTVKTLKGVGGDTGIVLKPTGWIFFTITPGSTGTFVINSSAADTGLTTEIIFF